MKEKQHARVAVHGAGPVYLARHVDSDEDIHFSLRCGRSYRRPALAVVALQSDGSRSPISGRDGRRKRGEMPAEPWSAASMMSIPASVPSPDHTAGEARRSAEER
jgi:hypothetical protein